MNRAVPWKGARDTAGQGAPRPPPGWALNTPPGAADSPAGPVSMSVLTLLACLQSGSSCPVFRTTGGGGGERAWRGCIVAPGAGWTNLPPRRGQPGDKSSNPLHQHVDWKPPLGAAGGPCPGLMANPTFSPGSWSPVSSRLWACKDPCAELSSTWSFRVPRPLAKLCQETEVENQMEKSPKDSPGLGWLHRGEGFTLGCCVMGDLGPGPCSVSGCPGIPGLDHAGRCCGQTKPLGCTQGRGARPVPRHCRQRGAAGDCPGPGLYR